jgi:hypothetical protein
MLKTNQHYGDSLGSESLRKDSSEKLDEEQHIPIRKHRSNLSVVKILSVLKELLLIAVAILAITTCYKVLSHSSTPKSCACGSSVAEAKTMGCEYDSIAAAWLPPHCMDKELLAEFDKSGDGPGGRWYYWVDENHTQEYSIEEVGLLADKPGTFFYTTPGWHFGHCKFYWRKQQRAKFTGVTIERRYDNERHVKHCGEMFKNSGMTAYSYVELDSDNTEPPEFLKNSTERV